MEEDMTPAGALMIADDYDSNSDVACAMDEFLDDLIMAVVNNDEEKVVDTVDMIKHYVSEVISKRFQEVDSNGESPSLDSNGDPWAGQPDFTKHLAPLWERSPVRSPVDIRAWIADLYQKGNSDGNGNEKPIRRIISSRNIRSLSIHGREKKNEIMESELPELIFGSNENIVTDFGEDDLAKMHEIDNDEMYKIDGEETQ